MGFVSSRMICPMAPDFQALVALSSAAVPMRMLKRKLSAAGFALETSAL
jgi:hypothetical protein